MCLLAFLSCLEKRDFANAKNILEMKTFHVNKSVSSEILRKFPKISTQFEYNHSVSLLLLVLANVKYDKYDPFYDLARYIIKRQDIRINDDIIGHGSALAGLCNINNPSIAAVSFLLNDERCDVNKQEGRPLHNALHNIKQEGDVFENISKLLLNHKHISVNSSTLHGSIRDSLIKWGPNNAIGIKLMMTHPKLHIYCDNPAYHAVFNNKENALRLILKHPDFDVNKVCDCCKYYRLPITGLFPGNRNILKFLVEA